MDWLGHAAPCGLLALRPDGTIVTVNETFATWVGIDASAIVGTSFKSYLDAPSQLFYETRHAPVLQLRGEARGASLVLRAEGGRALHVLIDAINRTRDGEPQTVVALFDATERIGYEQQLLDAQREAERLDRESRVLQAAAAAFALADSEDTVGSALVELARDGFGAPYAAVFLRQEDGGFSLLSGTNVLEPHLRGASPRLAQQALDARTVVVVPDMPAADAISRALGAAFRAARVEALTIAPLLDEGAQVGVLVCYFGRPREFDEADTELHLTLTRQAAQALVRMRVQQRLRQSALHDPLTGLPNRQLFEEHLQLSKASAIASNRMLGVLFMDLDGFKAVNDTFGHPVGDAVLAQVGGRMRLAMRDEDVVGRYGGDEFVAACALDNELSAAVVGERLRAEVSRRFRGIPRRYRVTASVGVVVVDPVMSLQLPMERFIELADGAMYESKSSGRNRVTVVRLQG